MFSSSLIKTFSKYSKNVAKSLSLAFIVLIVVFSIDSGFYLLKVEAGVSHNVSGYAWSDTIGWISFNCTDTSSCDTSDYGVGINDSNGNLFGYAWSSNIGWIAFDQSKLTGCPSGPCEANLTGGTLTGWAKALSSEDLESGGWDGWISLSGSNYGVTFNNNEFSGYAWGSAIVGWVDFNPSFGGVVKNILSADLTTSSNNIQGGEPVTLTWTSTIAAQCTGTNFSTSGATSGSVVINPDLTKNYTLTCSNDFDSVEDVEQVQVWNTECADGTDNDIDGNIDYPNDLGCSGLGDDNESSVEFVVKSIVATPSLVKAGDTTVISWNTENVEAGSCTVTGNNGDSWVGDAGSQTTSVISEEVIFTLSCLDIEGAPSASETVTVSLVPVFQEF